MSTNLLQSCQEESAISCERLLKYLTQSKTINASKYCVKLLNGWKPTENHRRNKSLPLSRGKYLRSLLPSSGSPAPSVLIFWHTHKKKFNTLESICRLRLDSDCPAKVIPAPFEAMRVTPAQTSSRRSCSWHLNPPSGRGGTEETRKERCVPAKVLRRLLRGRSPLMIPLLCLPVLGRRSACSASSSELPAPAKLPPGFGFSRRHPGRLQ